MKYILILTGILLIPFLFNSAYAQQNIQINSTVPCIMDLDAGMDILLNCNYKDDFLSFAFLPWEYITGGYFSLFLTSLLVLFSYIKYHKVVYPILIGVVMLPSTYMIFPSEFLSFAIIFVTLALMGLLYFIYIKQTKEY